MTSSLFNFSKILVPVDGTEQAMRSADYALSIAKKDNAKVIAIFVSGIKKYMDNMHVPDGEYEQMYSRYTGEAQEKAGRWFDMIRKKAQANGVEFTSEVIDPETDVIDAVVDYAARNRIDLVVIGAKDVVNGRKTIMGTVAAGIVSFAHCPVLVVRMR